MRKVFSGTKRVTLGLAGDGLLVTSALFGVLTAMMLSLVNVLPKDSVWIGVLAFVLMVAGAIAGPVIAWRLHERRIDGAAVLGGVIGYGVAGPVFMLAAAFAGALGWLLSPISKSEFAGPIALLIIVSAAYLGCIVWLVAEAVRDLASKERRHERIDWARLAAAAVLVLFAVGVTALALRPGEGEMFEAFIFAYVSGIGGAMALLGADAAQTIDSKGEVAATEG